MMQHYSRFGRPHSHESSPSRARARAHPTSPHRARAMAAPESADGYDAATPLKVVYVARFSLDPFAVVLGAEELQGRLVLIAPDAYEEDGVVAPEAFWGDRPAARSILAYTAGGLGALQGVVDLYLVAPSEARAAAKRRVSPGHQLTLNDAADFARALLASTTVRTLHVLLDVQFAEDATTATLAHEYTQALDDIAHWTCEGGEWVCFGGGAEGLDRTPEGMTPFLAHPMLRAALAHSSAEHLVVPDLPNLRSDTPLEEVIDQALSVATPCAAPFVRVHRSAPPAFARDWESVLTLGIPKGRPGASGACWGAFWPAAGAVWGVVTAWGADRASRADDFIAALTAAAGAAGREAHIRSDVADDVALPARALARATAAVAWFARRGNARALSAPGWGRQFLDWWERVLSANALNAPELEDDIPAPGTFGFTVDKARSLMEHTDDSQVAATLREAHQSESRDSAVFKGTIVFKEFTRIAKDAHDAYVAARAERAARKDARRARRAAATARAAALIGHKKKRDDDEDDEEDPAAVPSPTKRARSVRAEAGAEEVPPRTAATPKRPRSPSRRPDAAPPAPSAPPKRARPGSGLDPSGPPERAWMPAHKRLWDTHTRYAETLLEGLRRGQAFRADLVSILRLREHRATRGMTIAALAAATGKPVANNAYPRAAWFLTPADTLFVQQQIQLARAGAPRMPGTDRQMWRDAFAALPRLMNHTLHIEYDAEAGLRLVGRSAELSELVPRSGDRGGFAVPYGGWLVPNRPPFSTLGSWSDKVMSLGPHLLQFPDVLPDMARDTLGDGDGAATLRATPDTWAGNFIQWANEPRRGDSTPVLVCGSTTLYTHPENSAAARPAWDMGVVIGAGRAISSAPELTPEVWPHRSPDVALPEFVEVQFVYCRGDEESGEPIHPPFPAVGDAAGTAALIAAFAPPCPVPSLMLPRDPVSTAFYAFMEQYEHGRAHRALVTSMVRCTPGASVSLKDAAERAPDAFASLCTDPVSGAGLLASPLDRTLYTEDVAARGPEGFGTIKSGSQPMKANAKVVQLEDLQACMDAIRTGLLTIELFWTARGHGLGVRIKDIDAEFAARMPELCFPFAGAIMPVDGYGVEIYGAVNTPYMARVATRGATKTCILPELGVPGRRRGAPPVMAGNFTAFCNAVTPPQRATAVMYDCYVFDGSRAEYRLPVLCVPLDSMAIPHQGTSRQLPRSATALELLWDYNTHSATNKFGRDPMSVASRAATAEMMATVYCTPPCVLEDDAHELLRSLSDQAAEFVGAVAGAFIPEAASAALWAPDFAAALEAAVDDALLTGAVSAAESPLLTAAGGAQGVALWPRADRYGVPIRSAAARWAGLRTRALRMAVAEEVLQRRLRAWILPPPPPADREEPPAGGGAGLRVLPHWPVSAESMARVRTATAALGRDTLCLGTAVGTLSGISGPERGALVRLGQTQAGIYGELTDKAVAEVVQWMVDECGLGATAGPPSALLDVGSGRGKVLAIAGALVPLDTLFGVELNPINHDIAVAAMGKVLPHLRGAPVVGLLCKDVSALESLAPFTHIYSFSFGMPMALLRRIVALAEASPSVSHLVLSFESRELVAELRAAGHTLLAQFTGRKEAGGGRCYPIWAFALERAAGVGRPDVSPDADVARVLGAASRGAAPTLSVLDTSPVRARRICAVAGERRRRGEGAEEGDGPPDDDVEDSAMACATVRTAGAAAAAGAWAWAPGPAVDPYGPRVDAATYEPPTTLLRTALAYAPWDVTHPLPDEWGPPPASATSVVQDFEWRPPGALALVGRRVVDGFASCSASLLEADAPRVASKWPADNQTQHWSVVSVGEAARPMGVIVRYRLPLSEAHIEWAVLAAAAPEVRGRRLDASMLHRLEGMVKWDAIIMSVEGPGLPDELWGRIDTSAVPGARRVHGDQELYVHVRAGGAAVAPELLARACAVICGAAPAAGGGAAGLDAVPKAGAETGALESMAADDAGAFDAEESDAEMPDSGPEESDAEGISGAFDAEDSDAEMPDSGPEESDAEGTGGTHVRDLSAVASFADWVATRVAQTRALAGVSRPAFAVYPVIPEQNDALCFAIAGAVVLAALGVRRGEGAPPAVAAYDKLVDLATQLGDGEGRTTPRAALDVLRGIAKQHRASAPATSRVGFQDTAHWLGELLEALPDTDAAPWEWTIATRNMCFINRATRMWRRVDGVDTDVGPPPLPAGVAGASPTLLRYGVTSQEYLQGTMDEFAVCIEAAADTRDIAAFFANLWTGVVCDENPEGVRVTAGAINLTPETPPAVDPEVVTARPLTSVCNNAVLDCTRYIYRSVAFHERTGPSHPCVVPRVWSPPLTAADGGAPVAPPAIFDLRAIAVAQHGHWLVIVSVGAPGATDYHWALGDGRQETPLFTMGDEAARWPPMDTATLRADTMLDLDPLLAALNAALGAPPARTAPLYFASEEAAIAHALAVSLAEIDVGEGEEDIATPAARIRATTRARPRAPTVVQSTCRAAGTAWRPFVTVGAYEHLASMTAFYARRGDGGV